MHQAGKTRQRCLMIFLAAAVLTAATALPAPLLYANGSSVRGADEAGRLDLVSGKSILLRTEKPVKRVSIASTDTASYMTLSPRELYVTGKSAGSTNMIIWQENGDVKIYDLEVSYDVSGLKEALYEMFPGEKDLQVTAARNAITLSGRVTGDAELSRALETARAYAPEGRVNNLVEVGGNHQVMLEVRVAEMQKSMARRLGVNFSYVDGNEFGVSTLGSLTRVVEPDDANVPPDGPVSLLVSPAVNALFRVQPNGGSWTGFVDVLKENGLVKVLAEPTLIAMSGQSADFLAGGEFPVPVPQGLGSVAIEYRNFGVGLAFTPTVLGPERISLEVAPEVSELDFSTAVRFEGFVVPGVTTRRASTVVELADGQSFAIAGLLRDTARDQYSRYPLLGKIPVLGALFQSRSFQQNETELIIIATPRLVKPIDGEKQPLPTDFYHMPGDEDFYFLGKMEGKPPEKPEPSELDGEFGYAVPDDF